MKDWKKYNITLDVDEMLENGEIKQAFIVFEEEADSKTYDLCKGIFSDLAVAKEYADELNRFESDESCKNYVADYSDYIAGSYNYL